MSCVNVTPSGSEYQALSENNSVHSFYYSVVVDGYGYESVMGEITDEAYQYWDVEPDGISFESYLWDDGVDIDAVPDDVRFVEPGEWEMCDNIAHVFGPEMTNASNITIFDEDDREVWSAGLDISELQSVGVPLFTEKAIDTSIMESGTNIYEAFQVEQGTFFTGEIITDEMFDPQKLRLLIQSIDGKKYLEGLEYFGTTVINVDRDTNGEDCEVNIKKVK